MNHRAGDQTELRESVKTKNGGGRRRRMGGYGGIRNEKTLVRLGKTLEVEERSSFVNGLSVLHHICVLISNNYNVW